MIRKIKGLYVVLSEKTGRRFGTYKTFAEAKKRLRQIEFSSILERREMIQLDTPAGKNEKDVVEFFQVIQN